MTRLAMIVDIINQDLIIPNVEKVAKLCADFKSGVETIFVSKDNKQEYIEVDDSVRQGDYKYTYSDNSNIALKSEKADLVVSAVERFAQAIPLNLQEIFLWYFEQKGVDNPERFLLQQGVNGVNGEQIENGKLKMENLENIGQIPESNLNPENQLSNLPPQPNTDVILGLINLISQISQGKVKNTSELEELINSMEQLLEEK